MQELSLKEILKAIIPKIKALVIIFIVGAMIGGCVGFVIADGKQYFGTNIEFYVSPRPGENGKNNDSQYGVYGAYGWHVMDNITKLLSSESFAEELLLGEDRLPLESALPDASDAKRAELDRMISEIKDPLEKYAAAKAEMEAAAEAYAQRQQEHTLAVSVANKAGSVYKSLVDAGADEESIDAALQRKNDADRDEMLAKVALDNAEIDRNEKKAAAKKLAVSDLSLGEIYDLWRETDAYKKSIALIMKSVNFSFYNERDLQVSSSTETLAKSFIYVDINVTESLETADFVYGRIVDVLPRYVQTNMAVPSGYVGTNCQRISRLDQVKPVGSGTSATVALYAAVGGVLALCAASVMIVACDRVKKWYAINKKELSSVADADDAEKAE